MVTRGPDRKVGFLWHKKGGWYRRYDGKPKYFGGGGSVETTDEREADRMVKNAAHEAWIQYESEHYFGETKKIADHSAGMMMGMRKMFDIVTNEFNATNATPEQLELLAKRMRLATGVVARKIASKTEDFEVETIRPIDEGPTCQMVVDAYLAYLENNASNSHFLDATARLLKWTGEGEKSRAIHRQQNVCTHQRNFHGCTPRKRLYIPRFANVCEATQNQEN